MTCTYLAHQEIESVNIASIVIVGEIDCGSQPFCADSCEVAFLILWQDAQVQSDGHSYQVSFDCRKSRAAQEQFNNIRTHVGEDKNLCVVTHL